MRRLGEIRLFDALSCALFALFGLAVFLAFRGYGLSWDEPLQHWYGQQILDYYLGGLQGRVPGTDHYHVHYYPGAFDLLVAIVSRVSPLWEYDTRHLVGGLTGLLGIVGCWSLARRVAGDRAAFFAAVLLATFPAWFGHALMNPKDLPHAVAHVWALVFLVRCLDELPRVTWRSTLGFGVAAGLAMGTRLGGGSLLIYALIGLTLHTWLRRRRLREHVGLARFVVAGMARWFAPGALVAFGVLAATWPWIHRNPVGRMLDALAMYSHFPWHFDLLFRGEPTPVHDLPWTYLPVMYSVKLPEVFVVALLAAVAAGAVALLREGVETRAERALVWIPIVLSILFPVVLVWTMHSVLYDGVRHFLFVAPPMAVIAGAGLSWWWSRARGFGPKVVLGVLVAGGCLATVSSMVHLHPYTYTYFNRMVGGVAGASGRFEIDYWALSYRDAVELLREHLSDPSNSYDADATYAVGFGGATRAGALYLRGDPRLTSDWESPDYYADLDFYISFARQGYGEKVSGPVIGRVVLDGATLCDVVAARAAEP